ncbi:MAG: hypothetical protein JWO53_926 [Chlamydiia bacterium]|nr:hypothetical protein [Chlamydiia bacterium]
MSTYYPKNAEETFLLGQNFGQKFAQSLCSQKVICFFGELGAGKTTFIKGLGFALGIDPSEINSPTFQYLNTYTGKMPLYHFDLYRLQGAEDFLNMDFDEFFSSQGICCVEWAERIASIIPKDAIQITICHTEDGGRKIEVRQC